MNHRPLFVGPLIHLRTVPAFEALSPNQLSALAHETEEVLVPRGTPLMEGGQHAEAMYFIVDGSVAVENRGGATFLGAGHVVGFLETLARVPVAGHARAESDVVALRLEVDELREACEAHFGIVSSLLTDVAKRVSRSREALREAIGGREDRAGPAPTPLDRVGRILALHRSAAFPSAGMDALAELAGQITDRAFDPHEALWDDDEGPEGAFLICSGEVSVLSLEWPEPIPVGPGGVPGLVMTLAEAPGDIHAVANTEVVALRVAKEPLLDLLEDHAEMAFAFLGRLARCLLLESPVAGRDQEPPGQPG